MNFESHFINLINLFVWLGIDYNQRGRSARKTIVINLWFSFLMFVYSFNIVAGSYFLFYTASHIEEFTSCLVHIASSITMLIKLANFKIYKSKFEGLVKRIVDLGKSMDSRKFNEVSKFKIKIPGNLLEKESIAKVEKRLEKNFKIYKGFLFVTLTLIYLTCFGSLLQGKRDFYFKME